MQNNLSIFLLVGLTIGLTGIFLRCNLVTNFSSNEKFIPRNEIKKDINSFQNLRVIQLLNWPVIKKELLKKYPMIDSIKLSFRSFPNIDVSIEEKRPWVMLINKNDVFILSQDGVQLNNNLVDVELPNQKILIVNTELNVLENKEIKSELLVTLAEISIGLLKVPLFKLQQILYDQSSIQMIEDNGLVINLGTKSNLELKFDKLKYFFGANRQNIDQIQFIDIQFPKRVIIK